MRTSKKLLSILLTIIMVFSLMIGGLTTAFAATATGKPTSTAADGGYFNAAELTAGVTIDAPLGTSGAVAGDTIQLLVNTVPVTTLDHILIQADIDATTYSFTVYAIDLGDDGFKTITTRIVDAASVVGAESPALNVTVFTTAPVVAGVVEGGFYQTVSPTFEGTATLTTGAGSPVSYNSGDAITGDSAQVLEVMDSAGNVTTVSFTTDNTAPIAPSVTNTGYINSTNSTPYAITGIGEADATVDVTVTDSASVTTTVYAPSVTVDTYGNFSTTVDTFTLAEGSISITATQTDAAGNVSTVSPSASVTMDTTAPTITSIASDAAIAGVLKIGQTILFTLTPGATEAGATGVGSYNGQALTWSTADNGVTYTATYTVASGDADQATALQISGVTITDAAGNVSTATSGSGIMKTIDANPPTAPTVDILNGALYDANGVTPNISAPVDATQTITLNGAAYTSGAITTDGAHLLVITNTDAAGNASATTVDFTVDAVVPTITLVGSSTVTVDQGSTYTDAGATASDNLDGDITASIITSGTVDTNTVGSYTITYNVNDIAGNTATEVTRTVVVASPVTLSSIAITAPATKLIYTVGDALDISGMEVTGTYSDDSTAVETITSTDVAGFNSSAPAVDQLLTITVGGKTTTYTVTINAAPVTPEAPAVTADDANNVILGADATMEYSIDAGVTWALYDIATPPTFPGAVTVEVRVAADTTTGAPAGASTTLTFTAVGDITGNNILLIGDYAFDLSDPANNNYSLNNFLVAANTAYLNTATNKYEVYFRIGDAWYDIISDPDMSNQITDLTTINGDGLYTYMNMQ